MTDLLDPLALAATAATVAAVVWIGHRADVARRRRPPVVEIEPPAPAGLTPCRGMSNGGVPAVLTQTHRAWVIVPENIGGPLPQMCEADPPAEVGATYADLVVQIEVPSTTEETPP